MEKDKYYHDEMIANNTTIDKMNNEYAKLLSPNTLKKISSFLPTSKQHKSTICMPDFDIIERIYNTEKSMVTSLLLLYKKCRLPSTKDTISKIINIKNKVASSLAKLYNNGTGKTIDEHVHTVDRPTYNALYDEIYLMEVALLEMMDNIHSLYVLTMKEHSSALMMIALKP